MPTPIAGAATSQTCWDLQAEKESSRRESLVGVLAASVAAASLIAQPAQAVLGIGEGTTKEDEYKEYTMISSLASSHESLPLPVPTPLLAHKQPSKQLVVKGSHALPSRLH